ncbi:MAG: hypothetical protein ACI9K3_000273 [Halovenus sp.]|jgi:hypothetical protein
MADTDRDRLDRALPAGARTVLLAGPPTDRMRSLCGAMHRADAGTALLIVTYTREPADYLDALDGSPGDITVVTVGDAAPQTDDSPVTTRHVEAPADLTQLGIEIDAVLEAHDRVSLCLDSLTTTLQYADYTDVYEFLHATTGRLRAAGARTHVHLNPLAHDEQVLTGLATLFDARVDLSAGALSVDARPLTGRNV